MMDAQPIDSSSSSTMASVSKALIAEKQQEMPRKSMHENIGDFFRGRFVFITGGTGFIGKVLIEKILRCCPDVAGVYVLMRPKKERSPFQRGEDLCNCPIFKGLREAHPHFTEKLIVLNGDISEENFGLHEDSLQRVTSDVSVVFHAAATVRFDEPLKQAVDLNVHSVQKLIHICRKIKHLKALVHVSTAYANCNRNHIEEIVYQPSVDPERLMELINWLPDDAVQAVTPHLLGPMPNTYTFTKGLAEYFLMKHASDLPLAIVRPSIVGAAWKEPIPGWIDNCNGPSLLFIATGKGFLRSMIGENNAVADVVPVDITVNLMMAAAWRIAHPPESTGTTELTVYNCTTGSVNPLRWVDIGNIVPKSFKKNPLELAWRRPNMSFTANPLMYNYWTSVSHLLPAYITDMVLRLIGKKPRLVRTFQKIHKAAESLGYFTTNQWEWTGCNVVALMHEMHKDDQQTFYLDTRDLNWTTYLEDYCLGAKRFILHEDINNLPKARQHLRRLQVLRYVLNTILIAMLWRFLVANSHLAGGLWYMVLNLVFKFVRFFRVTSSSR